MPGRRAGVLATITVLATIAAAWLPFVIADPHTVAAMHYTIRNMPGSALRALGISDPRTPSWDRPAQLLIGCALGVAAVRRGRWPAVILLGVGPASRWTRPTTATTPRESWRARCCGTWRGRAG